MCPDGSAETRKMLFVRRPAESDGFSLRMKEVMTSESKGGSS